MCVCAYVCVRMLVLVRVLDRKIATDVRVADVIRRKNVSSADGRGVPSSSSSTSRRS